MQRAVSIGLGLLMVLVLATSAMADTFRIEIDYMVDDGATPHSHQPTAQEIQAVVQMFACQGHTLIIDVSDEIPHYDVLQMDPDQTYNIFDYSGVAASFGALKAQYYDHAGIAGWHYCIFGHQYEWFEPGIGIYDSTSSGLAEMLGDDLLVTLGAFEYNGVPGGSPFSRAATLAHEFGHNLGLTHCGDMNCSDENGADWVGAYPLNVASVMSYFYQLIGVRSNLVDLGLAPDFIPFKNIDYSHGSMCSLDEEALSEELGTMMSAADWNCDGEIDPGTLRADLNGGSRDHWCGPDLIYGVRSVLSDFDEWAAITDMTVAKTEEQLKYLKATPCMTSEDFSRVADKNINRQPALTIEDCVTAEMRYVRADGRTGATGNCSDAYNSISEAIAGAPDGSVLILEPLSWDAQGIVLRNKAYLISTSSAVLE